MPEVKRRKRVETVRLRPPTDAELNADQQRRARAAYAAEAERLRRQAFADNERLLRKQNRINAEMRLAQDEPSDRAFRSAERALGNAFSGVTGALTAAGLRTLYKVSPKVRRGLRRGKRYADEGMRRTGRGAGKAVRYARSVPRKSASELRGEVGRAAGGAVSRVRSAARSVDAAELLANARSRASMAAVAAAGAGKSGVRRAVAAGGEPLQAVRSAIKDNKDRLRERGSEAMRKVNAGKAVKGIRGAVRGGLGGAIIGMGAGAGVGMARQAMNERTNGGSEDGIRSKLWEAAQFGAGVAPMVPGAVRGVNNLRRKQRIMGARKASLAERAARGPKAPKATPSSAPAPAAPKATVLNSSLGPASSGVPSPSEGRRYIRRFKSPSRGAKNTGSFELEQKPRTVDYRKGPMPARKTPQRTRIATDSLRGQSSRLLSGEKSMSLRGQTSPALAGQASMFGRVARGAAAGAARGSRLGLIGAVGGTLIGGAGGYRAYAEPKMRREMAEMGTGNAKADLQGRRVSGRQTTGAMGGRSAIGEVRSTNPEIRKKVAGVREAIGYATSVAKKRLDTGGDKSLASIQTQMQKSAAYRKLSPADQAKANTALGQWHRTQRKLNNRPI